MTQHYFIRYEAAAAGSMSRIRHPWIKAIEQDAPVEEAYECPGPNASTSGDPMVRPYIWRIPNAIAVVVSRNVSVEMLFHLIDDVRCLKFMYNRFIACLGFYTL